MANEKIVNRENLKSFREKFQDKLENGQIVPRLAKNLSPVSLESGATQETPFVLQGTGTANGTASVDTADVGKHLEKQGNSVVVNQLLGNNYTARGGTTITYGSDNWYKLSVSTWTSGTCGINFGVPMQNGHKYFVYLQYKNNTLTETTRLRCYDGNTAYLSGEITTGTSSGKNERIVSMSSGCTYIAILFTPTTNAETLDVKINVIDLTKWFNGDVPQDLSDHPEHWSRYQNYGDYIAYNTGTLTDSVGRYLQTGGRNLYDGENDIVAIPNATYYCYGTGVTLTYKDSSGNTISTETKTNETFVVPSNCNSIGVSGTGNICVSLYYVTGDGYDKYYPYEAPKTYDTGTEVLRKAGSIKDYKEPNGTIHRLVVSYTFTGEESISDFGTSGGNCKFKFTSMNSVGGTSSSAIPTNIICDKANIISPAAWYSMTATGFTIGVSGYGTVNRIQVSIVGVDTEENARTWITGKTIYFELPTPTTEQGTPFTENIEINDYGTMGWLDTNNAYVDVPQGCKIFYPADMSLFMDSLGQRTDVGWDASKIVSNTQLATDKTELQDVDTRLQNAIGGTLRNIVALKNNCSFADTGVADMGNLTYSYDSTNGYFLITNLVSRKYGADITCISTLYNDVGDKSGAAMANVANLSIASNDNNVNIKVKNTSYTDPTVFKNAMKGVLLAYEKA